jgi:outer membrane receptor for monomeric catechols
MLLSPRLLLLASCCVATLPLVSAQTAPAPSSAPATARVADEKDIVQLNVFQVSAESDDEYRAANTTTGTRYNTPVKDLPMNIEVLTPAFMRDIGALDIRDALSYVAGIQLDTTAGGVGGTSDNPENSTLLIRGISAAMKKDGFARFVPMDPITMSRADIIKGPGGALYGQNGTGGVVNVSSVQAGDRPVVRLGTSVGSYGFRRAELLVSTPVISKKVGFALPMAYTETKSNAMYFKMDTFVMNPTVTAKLGPNTTVLASVESRFNTRDNIRNFFLTDTGVAPDGTPYGTLIDGRPGTTRVLTTPNQRDFRFEGPDTFRKERTYVATYRLDHRFTDNIQWWGGYSSEDINVRSRSFGIALRNANDASIPLSIRTDPRFLAMLRPSFGTAQPQILDIRPDNITNSSRTVRPTWKSELYLAFDTGPVKHRLITGISYGPLRSGNNPNQNFYYGNTGNANDPATRAWEALPKEVILTRFRDPRDFTSVQRWNYAAINQYPQGPETAIGTKSSYLTSLFWDRNLYANLQSSFFHNKFQTIVGFFNSRNDRGGNVYDSVGNYLWNGPAPAGSGSTLNGVRRPKPVRNNAPSATAIWLPVEWVRLYANVMSAVDPGPAYSAYDGNGNPLDGAAVRNAEAGVRFDVFKSKLLLSLAGFAMSDKDRPVNFGAAIQNLLVSPTGTVNGSGFGAFVKTSTDSKGFDLKVDYVPMRNLRFNVGVSENNVQIKEIAPFATPANPDPVRLLAQQNFVNAGGSSSRYLGKPSTDISKYTGTGYVRYEFNQSFLKGTWAMFGAKYLGQREAELISVATNTGAITVDRRIVPSHYIYDFNLGYRRKIGRYTTNFQLNLPNLADDDKFYGAVWQTGRTYRLSASLNF